MVLQAEAGDGWRPERFELSFGLPLDADHDPHSVADPVVVDGRFVLRGSIDLVERHATSRALRVTDHKTGQEPHGGHDHDQRRPDAAAGALQPRRRGDDRASR